MQLSLVVAVLLSSVTAQTPPTFPFPSLLATTNLQISFPAYPNITPGQLVDLATIRAQGAPTVTFPGIQNGTTYTLLEVDPDARSNGTARTVLHWLQPNITASTPLALSNASAVATYLPPAPPPEIPFRAHRYTFLLFANALVLPAGFATPPVRVPFDAETFVRSAGLGNVVAATWFETGNSSLSTSPSGTGTGGLTSPTIAPANGGSLVSVSWALAGLGLAAFVLV